MSEETHNTSVTQPTGNIKSTAPTAPTVPTKTTEPPAKPQPTSTVKAPDTVKPQTVQTTETVTDPKQAPAPVKVPEPVKPQTTQTTELATSAKQPTAPVKATDAIKPQPTGNTVSTAPTPTKTVEPVKPPTAQPTVPAKTTEPVKPQTVQPTETAQEPVKPQITRPTEVTKLSDVIPTSKVWISGLIGNRQIDCLGPIEIPLKIDEPTYPFTPVPSNPDYTNQVFDYDTGEWIATDAKSQGQQLTDLTKKVASLQEDSVKYDQTVGQSKRMGLQLAQTMMQLSSKIDTFNTKIDSIVKSSKDGEK